MIVSGTYIKKNGTFKMHTPDNLNRTYIGYTLNQMKSKYREQFGLKGKHIEWIILGLED